MMPLISTFSKFQLRLLIFCLLIALSNSFSSTPASDTTSTTQASAKPILVVGATGRVGRIVVNQLLEKNQPVRALIRNTTKAQKLFGANINGTSSLELITADLGHYDDKECAQTLERAVIGCDSIISVSGTLRFSKLTDFLPWRLLRTNVTSWCNDDRRHPYYPNYQAQVLLINLAAKYNISRFVRVTGLSVGLPAFNPVSILFSGLLSMTSRYHALTEQYLRSSAVPYVILRPGGLTNSKRNKTTTSLQVDASGVLPPPARVGRSDVASLAVASCDSSIVPSDDSYTLAVRWVGDVTPKSQGTIRDGCDSAETCLNVIVQESSNGSSLFKEPKGIKPYGVSVGIFFYSFAAVSLKIGSMLLRAAMRVFRRV